jgi:hypothetical protein
LICLVVVGDQAYHCCVIGKLDDGVGVVPGHAVMCEQGVQEGSEGVSRVGSRVWTTTAILTVWGPKLPAFLLSVLASQNAKGLLQGWGLGLKMKKKSNIGQNTHHNKRNSTTLHKERPKTTT